MTQRTRILIAIAEAIIEKNQQPPDFELIEKMRKRGMKGDPKTKYLGANTPKTPKFKPLRTDRIFASRE